MAEPLWLTDRSRIETGLARCPRQRALCYHPIGVPGASYGLVRRGESLPLATGTYTHVGLEALCRHVKFMHELPPDHVVRECVKLALGQYEAKIVERGFRGLLASEQSDLVLKEQMALVEGMIWAFARLMLPWIHTEFEILEVEEEKLYPLGDGITLMQRLDLLGRCRTREGLAYIDFKTSGRTADIFAEEWETKPQLGLGTLGAEEKYGVPVTELYVIGLNKGYRKKDSQGVKRQESVFCYGYRRPANPPIAAEEWKPSYEWIDDQGQTRRAGRDFSKAPTYEYPGGTEAWVKSLPESVLKKQVFLVGPLQPQKAQLASLQHSIRAEELRWQQILWTLYEKQSVEGWQWSDPGFQVLLDKLVPCSWNCRPFGKGYECEFVDLCFRQPGWETPLESGKYAPRLPHHKPELDQMTERGLVPEGLEPAAEDEY